MEVKPGYKQTEIGAIPEDWETKKIRELCHYQNGSSLEKYFNGVTGYRVISIGNYNENGEYNPTEVYIDYSLKRKIEKYILDKGDLTMLLNDKTSVGNIIGRTIEISESNRYVFNQRTMRLSIKTPLLSVELLHQILNSGAVHRLIVGKAKPGTQIYINTSDVLDLSLSFPTDIKEQSRICSTILDTDLLIKSLEKLIEKKKNIKQGVMQELLTGKRRLPGFHGEWVVKSLSEIGEITGGGVDKKSRPNEDNIRLVNYLDVYKRDFIYSRELAHYVTASSKQIEKCKVMKGDVFFTPSSETREDIGISALATEDISDACYSYHVVRLRFNEEWNHLYKGYAFKTREFLEQAETLCEGSGKRYVLSLPKFRALQVRYPVDTLEQQAIADALFDLDKEIQSNEAILDKYRCIKNGMMQELLTGRIRLL